MLNEAKRNQYLAKLGISYQEYLASPHWKKIKAAFWRSGMPKACAFCGSKRFDLHHVTYDRIGKELPTDLLPLCPEHHKAVHEDNPLLDWGVVKVLRSMGGKTKKKRKGPARAPYKIKPRKPPQPRQNNPANAQLIQANDGLKKFRERRDAAKERLSKQEGSA